MKCLHDPICADNFNYNEVCDRCAALQTPATDDPLLEVGERGFPLVAHYKVFFCPDPSCGPHIVLLDQRGYAFAEFVMNTTQLTELEVLTINHIRKLGARMQ